MLNTLHRAFLLFTTTLKSMAIFQKKTKLRAVKSLPNMLQLWGSRTRFQITEGPIIQCLRRYFTYALALVNKRKILH